MSRGIVQLSLTFLKKVSKGRPGRWLVATPDYCWLRMPRDRGRYEDMTPRLVLNYEYYTYRNDYDAESTSNLITFDYDAVIQLEICL